MSAFGTAGTLGGGTPGGFSFGSTPTSTATGAGGGFSFGSTPTSTATGGGGFSFGSTPAAGTALAANTGTGFTFGTGATTATTTSTTTGFSFGGGGGTSGGSFSFAQPAATTTTTTAPSSGFSFGQPAATSTGGFSFGTPITGCFGTSAPATSSAPTTGFSFSGGPACTAPSTGFSLGGGVLGGTAPASTGGFSFLGGTQTPKSSGFTLGGATPQSAVSTSGGLGGVGLGGAQPPSTSADANNAGTKSDGKSTKDQQLTQDLFATIALFESRRNAENSASEENIRQTAAPFHKVGKKAKEIQKLLAELASEYSQLHANALNLKAEVMKEAEHVEMARRTKETSMALQGENKAPEQFFIGLVHSFEAEMMYCRTQIEEVSQCMQAASNPCETPEDIAEVLQREHDTMKELAAKVYTSHSQLVELCRLLNIKSGPSEQAFFRPQAKEGSKSPASMVVRPVLGGSISGLQAFQEQQQRAKAVTLGAAPPTLPLAQTTLPSMFSNTPNTSGLFSTGGSTFGTSFNTSGGNTTSTFGTKPLFGSTAPTSTPSSSSSFSFGSPIVGTQQQQPAASPFSSPFASKPFGEDDVDSRRKRRL